MQNSVGHSWYADLVPLCIRDSTGPGIQSLGFHRLWVHEPRLVLFWVSYKHVQNSVGHPQNADLVPFCICPGIQSSWFHLLWVHEPRSSPLWVSEKLMQNSVGHSWYADLVPLCVGESPGPGCLDPDGAGAQVHVDVQGASHQLQAKVVHL